MIVLFIYYFLRIIIIIIIIVCYTYKTISIFSSLKTISLINSFRSTLIFLWRSFTVSPLNFSYKKQRCIFIYYNCHCIFRVTLLIELRKYVFTRIAALPRYYFRFCLAFNLTFFFLLGSYKS